MPTAHRRRLPKPDRRRALELLASRRDGCVEAIMLVELVRDGLATKRTFRGPRRVPGVAIRRARFWLKRPRLEARSGGISLPINVCVMDNTSARTEKWH